MIIKGHLGHSDLTRYPSHANIVICGYSGFSTEARTQRFRVKKSVLIRLSRYDVLASTLFAPPLKTNLQYKISMLNRLPEG